MSSDVWASLKHFKRDSTIDNWGDPNKISALLLIKLDALREFLGTPVIVTSGFRNHDTGQHGKGLALDVVVPQWEKSFLDFYLAAERFAFKGLGVYKGWKYRDREVPGLHIDERDLDGGYAARWLGIGNSKKINQYMPLTVENLLKYEFISSQEFLSHVDRRLT